MIQKATVVWNICSRSECLECPLSAFTYGFSRSVQLFVVICLSREPGHSSADKAAPTVWNTLALHLRSPSISRGQFRAWLKTRLFNQASENILF